MKTISLQSGSNGNCIYVEHKRTRLLFDAGISGVKAERRLAVEGIDIRDVDALIVSHDHSDHVRCAGVYQRLFGIPMFITTRTFHAAGINGSLGRLREVEHFEAGRSIEFANLVVHTLATPHDCAEGVVFVVEADDGKRLGILTDLGHVFDGLGQVVSGLDAMFIESNHDRDMLRGGPYPEFLKRRIRGQRGHLSNLDAARLVDEAGSGDLKWVCLAHLSGNNNRPDLALHTHRTVLRDRFALLVASRHAGTGILMV